MHVLWITVDNGSISSTKILALHAPQIRKYALTCFNKELEFVI